ncbi:hypothetical protein KHQ06_00430 [Nocardia tengchongensis]|uniref:Uncharacterized protein n=1 Tax=Nocardia tengchongensis TaxID=2055889 RepID=A0ABX8CS46_9NOCA|nr:hypothetical protein KHQ06_00430 [Nocardia tengchongensis]
MGPTLPVVPLPLLTPPIRAPAALPIKRFPSIRPPAEGAA